ncbi:MAG TPA: DUF1109 domain-containing protein [Bosea sp. (in: a-proteobacteria)]|jgi:hypothetical protein|uniref:DUF1109 domain-containing protein n=1 Tax=Bosea sp. (in: a-proteobacteria) TaxID=1871050 RepID=UPI002DDD62D9|nr:DUF1109 domain-containing protein [Bosea sp. (in: a-proteobacteria)]HEV2555558.1 DUF1109 domain-containing protein [Bosea sp. (in: a-proteobacteria)]
MKTDDLAAILASDAGPVGTANFARATGLTALAGLAACAAAILFTIGPRIDLAFAMATTPVLAKFALGASVAGLALFAYQRSLRPGRATAGVLALVLLPVAAVIAWALAVLTSQPMPAWPALLLGRSWSACLVLVPLYALLPLAGLFALARRGAPVRPRLTGLAAGIGAAGLATLAYALHCPEDAAPFLATWYPLAMAVAGGLGALAGPRLLRW